MREGMFIKRNVDKWNQYQHEKTSDPDETAERFITLVDDLSYAKTFYPQSKVTRWINGIAAGIYLNLYKNKKEKYSRVITFWKYELPFLFKRYHKIFLFTFLMFTAFVFIGVFSSMKDETFVRGVLGNEYVDMTEQNIANGDPFGVYKDEDPFRMFVRIAINNTRIAFVMALGGILLGVVTLYLMWSNGLMLGCFQYMFFAKGLGMQSVMVIWIHGTLEILALILSSAAGFIIAGSILFPGTYSRLISFKRGVKDALKIMIVLVPVFILASFLENYVTHLMSNTYDKASNEGLPLWTSASILALSLSFIVWYFVIYPIILHRRIAKNSTLTN
ncbi:MAG: stage II sporulation protein M [Chitinophagaceae bacterium]|nr:stage II sporulation protein M [Chitinophagaceae bacterium]